VPDKFAGVTEQLRKRLFDEGRIDDIEETVSEAEATADEEERGVMTGRDDPQQPRLVVRSSMPTMGPPVLGRDRQLSIWAKGFDASIGPVEFLFDGQPVDVSDQKIGPEGTVAATLSVAADVAQGEHHIEVLQGSGRAPRRTKAIFIVAEFDEHLHEGATSRLVDQPLEPEGANTLEDDGA
jgi:hypothetical protein